MAETSAITWLAATQFLLYALGWAVCGWLMPRDRRNAWFWGAFMLCTGLGLVAVSMRGEPRTWWAYTGSNLLFSAGYVGLWCGIDAFLDPARRRLEPWVAIGVFSVVLVALGPGAEHAAWRAVLSYGFGAYALLRLPIVVNHEAHRVVGAVGKRVMQVPAALVGGSMLLRCVQQLLQLDTPLEMHRHSPGNDAALIGYLVGAALFNFCFGTLVVLRRLRELHELSQRDELTGLFNRRAMQGELEREWQRMVRSGVPFALLAIDLDHFKHINDRHGHASGDAVLAFAARLLQDGSRQIDRVARMGGEEFLVLMPQAQFPGAQGAAERLCAALRAQAIDLPGGRLAVTASFGVAVASVGDAGWSAVLARADAALYRAKERGRDRVEVAATVLAA